MIILALPVILPLAGRFLLFDLFNHAPLSYNCKRDFVEREKRKDFAEKRDFSAITGSKLMRQPNIYGTPMTLQNLDKALLETGVVDEKLFGLFGEAWRYDSATPIQWLEGRLRVLLTRVRAGGMLSLYRPRGEAKVEVSTVEDFQMWVDQYFQGLRI